MNNIIPKIIHFCWFGGNPLPESAQRCIESWKKYCPDYEIIRWDESNYDINACQYVREAYKSKKWAFVSDYARFDLLYTYGGLYFDTDVELIAPIDDIVATGPFLGIERNLEQKAKVAPGLGMAAVAGLPIFEVILGNYRNMSFILEDGSYNQMTIVDYTTDVLSSYGLCELDKPQYIAGIWVYPWDYFCPMMYETGELNVSDNTRSIHHYTASWLSPISLHLHRVQILMCKTLGIHLGIRLARAYSFPYRLKRKIEDIGIKGTIQFAMRKLRGHNCATEKESLIEHNAKEL